MSMRGNGTAYGRDGHEKKIKTLKDAIEMLDFCAEQMAGYDDCWRLVDRMAQVDAVRLWLEELIPEGNDCLLLP